MCKEFLWDWLKHENGVLANRGSFMLLAESILVASVVMISTESPIPQWIICVCGFIITAIWLFVNLKHIYGAHRVLDRKLKDKDNQYKEILNEMSEQTIFWIIKLKWRNHFLLWIGIPIVFLSIWISALSKVWQCS